MPKSEIPPTANQQPLFRRTAKWKWRIVVLAIIVAIACLFHAPLLRGLARVLIVDQPTDDYDCICISPWGHRPNGDQCYDVAADLYRKKPACRVLLVEPDPNRLDEIGAMASFAPMSQRELLARGVPQESLSVLHGERWNDWATARTLAAWLRDHPDHSVLLLSGQFHSAQFRHVLDVVLDTDDAARVRVRACATDDTMIRTGGPAEPAFWRLEEAGFCGFRVGWAEVAPWSRRQETPTTTNAIFCKPYRRERHEPSAPSAGRSIPGGGRPDAVLGELSAPAACRGEMARRWRTAASSRLRHGAQRRRRQSAVCRGRAREGRLGPPRSWPRWRHRPR